MDISERRPGADLIELRRELSLVLGTSGVGQGPPRRVGEPRPAHPPVCLEVEEQLLRLAAVETEARHDPRSVGEPEEPHTVESQHGGF